jgi:hypothetical protein
MIHNEEKFILSRGKKKLVSVLIPSRGRIDKLLEVIDNVVEKSADVNKIEILIRFDSDDFQSIEKIKDLPFNKVDIYVLIGERFRGYRDLHFFVNELSSLSRGEFIFLFNDDSYIVSEKWENNLEPFSNQVVILKPETKDDASNYNTFPIINRSVFEILHHFSLQTHNDTWMQEIGRNLNIERSLYGLEIFHDRPDNPNKKTLEEDETWVNGRKTWNTSRVEFDEGKYQILRQQDIMDILNYYKSK